eukprot:1247353-Pleurochrysis_carterae.AAC.1
MAKWPTIGKERDTLTSAAITRSAEALDEFSANQCLPTEEKVMETTSIQGDLGAARRSRERVASALHELACVVKAKKPDTRTANSITSDREPLIQGASVGIRCRSLSCRAVTRSRSPTRRALDTIRVLLCPLWRVPKGRTRVSVVSIIVPPDYPVLGSSTQ